MKVMNELQKYLFANKADRMTDEELKHLMDKLDINVKFEDGLVMFMYRDFADFSNLVVQNCRGIILYRDTFDIACYPFDKFNNYTSQLASDIDWKSARVLEKLDGQILKLWFNKYTNVWVLSSNGAIYTRDIIIRGGKTVGWLFDNSVSKVDYTKLNKDKTYIFEIVSPYNKVIIDYNETEIYHIGTRDNITQKEEETDIGISKPKIYNVKSLAEAIETANKICVQGDRHEGFVVVDKNYNRIKVKSQYYFDCKFVMGKLNGSKEVILELIDSLSEDEINSMVQKVPEMEQLIVYYKHELTKAYNKVDKLFKDADIMKAKYEYRMDYISWVDSLVVNKKLRKLLVKFYGTTKTIEEFKQSVNKALIYSIVEKYNK